jgi:hypothetical protein
MYLHVDTACIVLGAQGWEPLRKKPRTTNKTSPDSLNSGPHGGISGKLWHYGSALVLRSLVSKIQDILITLDYT